MPNKHILREVPPEQTYFDSFDNDCLTERGGDYCYNLFIVPQYRHSSGFNKKSMIYCTPELKNLLECTKIS